MKSKESEENMLFFEKGAPGLSLTDDDLAQGLTEALNKAAPAEKTSKVLVLPPDITRFHSRAGVLTLAARDYYNEKLTDVMPALGTHYPMTEEELDEMFPGLDHALIRPHQWRTDVVTLGQVPSSYVEEISEGKVSFSWPAQVNKLLVEGDHDLILSIGQVVPHEVIGFANHNKNIFVGTGGSEGIHKSHFLGAAYGMERIMGQADSPVRKVLNYASEHFASDLPILYALTVVSPDEAGKLHVRGLYIGDGFECFAKAAALSKEVNFTPVDEPLKRVVVYLDPKEFRSTWLGNKSVYRTRMAIADGGELIVIAPGLKEFGEDRQIDALIRKYGYFTTGETLRKVQENEDLSSNLSAAAHLIHGSSEGRFKITYAPGHLTRDEIESVGYAYADLSEMQELFQIENKTTGFQKDANGEEFYYIQNPALGLWSSK
ncbi:lactate racemase domain-containing protein [Spirochaeta isovalerica]|uniref:Nickel-dependent lactate racemase n=1 Tax=Spirochaeta isovalerica TaxID=150 RepID=A0A841R7H5_9SPIO|nr:lactate racemase domain-containing protein [Spirochaeta isovalerica]MBB6479331.1 nickel-dependent lactate racemase [Spirochaeta isovalerica]